jgi:hypothetical protein
MALPLYYSICWRLIHGQTWDTSVYSVTVFMMLLAVNQRQTGSYDPAVLAAATASHPSMGGSTYRAFLTSLSDVPANHFGSSLATSVTATRSQNCEMRLLVSSCLSICLSVCLSVRPSVCMEQLGPHRTDFHEICALLRYYAASCDNCLPTFRDKVSVPSSRVKRVH